MDENEGNADAVNSGHLTSPMDTEIIHEKVFEQPKCSPVKRPASPEKTQPFTALTISSPPPKKLRLQLDAGTAITAATATASRMLKKSHSKQYIYGNYNRYYGYRNQSEAEDLRLVAFKQHPEFFVGRDVCDIGCNYGEITMTIAREIGVKFITGLDIDKDLIGVARKHMAEARKNFKKSKSMDDDAAQPENNNRYEGFPYNMAFRQCNYVLDHEHLLDLVTEDFDTILCLSVTKWIHLNFGDVGLKLAFKRMYRQLRGGGRLILEAQPWKGYKRRKKLTPTILKNYQEIALFPNKFEEYLLSDEVGFTECYNLKVPSHSAKGFQRPIQVFVKRDKQKVACQTEKLSTSDAAVNIASIESNST